MFDIKFIHPLSVKVLTIFLLMGMNTFQIYTNIKQKENAHTHLRLAKIKMLYICRYSLLKYILQNLISNPNNVNFLMPSLGKKGIHKGINQNVNILINTK